MSTNIMPVASRLPSSSWAARSQTLLGHLPSQPLGGKSERTTGLSEGTFMWCKPLDCEQTPLMDSGTFMWCGWISKAATPNRRSAPAACHLHNCHWYLDIDEYTCTPVAKTKHKNWGAHRGARGTFAGKLAIGLKELHAQSDATSFTTWLTWQ